MLGLIIWKRRLAGLMPVPASATALPQRYSYGADQKFSPTAMALTGGIVALVGMGLMTTNMAIIKAKVPTIIEATNIWQKPTPPEPETKPQKTSMAKSVVTAPKSPLPPLSDPDVHAVDPVPGPVPFTPTAGGEPVPGPIELPRPDPVPLPPVANPVLTKAARDPRYASAFQPDYPPAMQRMEMEGRVSVRVLVGTDGRVKDVEILSATDPAFAAATERQARKAWRFKPATRDGIPQEEWITTSVVFRLDQG